MQIQTSFKGTHMAINKDKIRKGIKSTIDFLFNPRLLLCFGIAWIITNGWAYIAMAMGLICDIGWLATIGTTYLAFLWLPITPEKIITVAIAICLLKKLFPEDTKTLRKLMFLKAKAKREWRKFVSKMKQKFAKKN